MALFGGTPKDYNTIVAPLKKIEGDLTSYIGDQKKQVSDLDKEKELIDTQIATSNLEVRKSEHTVNQISALLATDFNGDGEPDFIEPQLPDITPDDDKDTQD